MPPLPPVFFVTPGPAGQACAFPEWVRYVLAQIEASLHVEAVKAVCQRGLCTREEALALVPAWTSANEAAYCQAAGEMLTLEAEPRVEISIEEWREGDRSHKVTRITVR